MSALLRWIRTAAVAIGAIAALALGITGFSGYLAAGRLGGWLLLVHMTFAPAMLIALVAIMMLFGGRFLPGAVVGPAPGSLSKLSFWFMMTAGTLCAATMTAAMFPLFGYAVQETLIAAHRYSAAAFLLFAVVTPPLARCGRTHGART